MLPRSDGYTLPQRSAPSHPDNMPDSHRKNSILSAVMELTRLLYSLGGRDQLATLSRFDPSRRVILLVELTSSDAACNGRGLATGSSYTTSLLTQCRGQCQPRRPSSNNDNIVLLDGTNGSRCEPPDGSGA
jgi:hypothetical protein